MKQSRKISGNPLKEFEERYKQGTSLTEITQENFDTKLGIALNGYTRMYDSKDSKRFLLKFQPDDQIEAVDDVTYLSFKTLGFVAKFLMDNKLDLSYHSSTELWFNEKIEELKSIKVEKRPRDAESLKERGQHIQQAIINRVREVMGELDQYIDDNKFKKKWDEEFNIVEWMISKNLSSIHGRKMVQRLQEEQQEFKDIETDDQLKEGYKFLNKRQIQYIITFYDYVIGELEKFINLQSNKRKQVRKPKAIKIEKVIKNFNYLKESEEFHIASVNPAEIIGSQICILYNVKYKTLKWIVAADKTGLQIKGSTIYNVNEEESLQQKLRKPEQLLSQLMQASKKEFFSKMQSLTTKASPTNSRCNTDCLILNTLR